LVEEVYKHKIQLVQEQEMSVEAVLHIHVTVKFIATLGPASV